MLDHFFSSIVAIIFRFYETWDILLVLLQKIELDIAHDPVRTIGYHQFKLGRHRVGLKGIERIANILQQKYHITKTWDLLLVLQQKIELDIPHDRVRTIAIVSSSQEEDIVLIWEGERIHIISDRKVGLNGLDRVVLEQVVVRTSSRYIVSPALVWAANKQIKYVNSLPFLGTLATYVGKWNSDEDQERYCLWKRLRSRLKSSRSWELIRISLSKLLMIQSHILG